MSFQVLKINRELLSQIESLLSASAGYPPSIQDELEYFDSEPALSWFVAFDKNEAPIGFVRSFDQGGWSLGELFVSASTDRALIATNLLNHFLKSNKFESGHRLRFDVDYSDAEFKSAMDRAGLNDKSQTFFYYELKLSKKTDYAKPAQADLSVLQVVETLSNLQPVTKEEVETWIKKDSIRVFSADGRIVSAAQINNYGDSAEINRIATHSDFLRRGFSKHLMQEICDELSGNGVERLFLKVEDVRIAAIKLYESFGLVKNEAKTQTWFSKYF